MIKKHFTINDKEQLVTLNYYFSYFKRVREAVLGSRPFFFRYNKYYLYRSVICVYNMLVMLQLKKSKMHAFYP